MNLTEKIPVGMSCLQLQWQMLLRPNKTCKFRAWLFISCVKILARIWVVLVFLPPTSATVVTSQGLKYRATCAASM